MSTSNRPFQLFSVLEPDEITEFKITSWRSKQINADMHRIGVPVGGNSLLHAVLQGFNVPYQRQRLGQDSETISKLLDRTELVLDLRKELSEKEELTETLATYQHIENNHVPSIAKVLHVNIYLVGTDKILRPVEYQMEDEYPNVYLLAYPTHYELLGQMRKGKLITSFTRDCLPLE